jgi:hypothetical protein
MRPLDAYRPVVTPLKPAPAPAAPKAPATPPAASSLQRPPRADGFDGRGGSRLSASVELAPPPPPPPPPAPKKTEEKGFFDKLKGGASDLKHKAGEVKDQVKDTLGDVKDTAVEVKDKALEEGGKLVDKAKDFGKGFTEALDYEENIDKLGPGDTYTLSVGGDVSMEGAKAYGKGTLEVTRNEKGEYIVSADGELGGGLYASAGGSVGARAKVEGELTAGFNGKVEMKFASAEEAKRAADTLVRMTGPAAAALKGGPPSGADLEFAAKHLSAVEVGGNQAAQLAADFGLGVKKTVGASVFAEGGVKMEYAARIEFDANRKPSLVFKTEMSGQVAAGGELGFNNTQGRRGEQTGANGGLQAGGSVKGSVTTEAKFDIPPGLDPMKLAKDPLGTLKEAGLKELKSLETKTTVKVQAEGTAGKNGGGYEAKLSVTMEGDKLVDGKALDFALRGQFDKALESTGEAAQVDASIRSFDKTGVDASPELKFMGFGGKATLTAERTDMADVPAFSFKGNGTQAAAALRDWKQGGGGNPLQSSLNQQVSVGRYLGGVRG